MIEMVLRYTDELRVGGVGRLWDQWLVQTFCGEALYCTPEFFVHLFQRADAITPVLGTGLRNSRPVLGLRQLPPIPIEPAQDQAIIGAQMQDQLPDAVRARDGMRRRLLGRDAIKYFENGWAMPRLTLPCPPQLLFQST